MRRSHDVADHEIDEAKGRVQEAVGDLEDDELEESGCDDQHRPPPRRLVVVRPAP